MMKKLERRTQMSSMSEPGVFKAGGCHSWTLYNAGNTNITIGGTLPLLPGQSFEGPQERPDVLDETELDVVFDSANNPETKAIDTGALPADPSYVKGVDPVPFKVYKLIIIRSYLS